VAHSVAGILEVLTVLGQADFFWNPKEATCFLFKLGQLVVLDFFKALDSDWACWIQKHLAIQVVSFCF
jgi:hypothetical protein